MEPKTPELDEALELLRKAVRYVGFVPFANLHDVTELRARIEAFLAKCEPPKGGNDPA